jgi:hypothetical protein
MKTSFACASRKTRFSLVKKKLLCYNRIKPFKKGYIALLLLLFAAIKRKGSERRCSRDVRRYRYTLRLRASGLLSWFFGVTE